MLKTQIVRMNMIVCYQHKIVIFIFFMFIIYLKKKSKVACWVQTWICLGSEQSPVKQWFKKKRGMKKLKNILLYTKCSGSRNV